MKTVADQATFAHASIAAPRELVASGVKRLDVYLRAADKGRFRWHHADGKPTIVDGGSVDHAVRVAQMVWRDVQVLSKQSDNGT